MSTRELAIVTRLLQQLVEMPIGTSRGIAIDFKVLVRLDESIRRMEAARAVPVLMQCCHALGD